MTRGFPPTGEVPTDRSLGPNIDWDKSDESIDYSPGPLVSLLGMPRIRRRPMVIWCVSQSDPSALYCTSSTSGNPFAHWTVSAWG